MISFSRRLDKLVKTISEQDIELEQDPVTILKIRKSINDINRAADKTLEGLAEIKQTLEDSGQIDNEVIKEFIEQLMGLSEGLKKGGNIRKSLEGLLALPIK